MPLNARIVKIVEEDSLVEVGQVQYGVYTEVDTYPETQYYDALAYETAEAASTLVADIESIHTITLV